MAAHACVRACVRVCCALPLSLSLSLPPSPSLSLPPPRRYVSQREWAKPYYPFYVAGPAYALPARAAAVLARHAHALPALPMEDVFVTGVAREAAGLPLLHNASFGLEVHSGWKKHQVFPPEGENWDIPPP